MTPLVERDNLDDAATLGTAMVGLIERDNLDDRREVYRLLQHVRPSWRWAWLAWVGRMPAKLTGAVVFDALDRRMTREAERGCPKADMYVTNSCYRLAFQWVASHGLDWGPIERGLTLLARGKITPHELPAAGKLRVSQTHAGA